MESWLTMVGFCLKNATLVCVLKKNASFQKYACQIQFYIRNTTLHNSKIYLNGVSVIVMKVIKNFDSFAIAQNLRNISKICFNTFCLQKYPRFAKAAML